MSLLTQVVLVGIVVYLDGIYGIFSHSRLCVPPQPGTYRFQRQDARGNDEEEGNNDQRS